MSLIVSPLYTGSRLLLPLATKIGLPLDQLNFVLAEFSGILFGFFMRWALPHSLNKPQWRQSYCLMIGLAFMFFLIGKASAVVLLQILLCYMVMKYFPEKYQHIVTFVLAFGILMLLYVGNFFKRLEYICYDETFPVMVTTQKVTTLAFGLSDWRLLQKGKKMVPDREKWAVRKLPGLWEYLAFTLSFQGVLAGPFCHYNLYRAFIEGNTEARLSEETKYPVRYEDDPSTCNRAVVTKVIAVFFWIFCVACVKPAFPDLLNCDPEFIASHGYLYRLGYLYISLFLHRTKYYVSWILADAVYNASGLGYVGRDEKGRPLWTGMSNVFVIKLETSSSLKVYLDNWNIMTTHWLRHVCYTRAPFMNTVLTFVLSGFWHGLLVGYYITFVGAAFFVLAARKIRITIRPLFQGTKLLRFVYDVLTTIATHVSLSYFVLAFVILDVEKIYAFHKSFYFSLYILVVLIVLFMPNPKRKRPTTESPVTREASSPDIKEVAGDFTHQSKVSDLQEKLAMNNNSNGNTRSQGHQDEAVSLGTSTSLTRRGGESVQRS